MIVLLGLNGILIPLSSFLRSGMGVTDCLGARRSCRTMSEVFESDVDKFIDDFIFFVAAYTLSAIFDS